MGLEINAGKATFVNIKEGKLYTKEKEKEPVFFDAISGIITGINFKKDEYQGKPYEKVEISLHDGEEKYILSMRTDSGYFRGFCNSLRSGDPLKPLRISPSSKVVDDKPQTTCFVAQNNKALKHTFTKDNQGDLPQLKKVQFKGSEFWDGSDQIEYWKNWLKSIQWNQELVNSPQPVSEPIENESLSGEDDLPF